LDTGNRINKVNRIIKSRAVNFLALFFALISSSYAADQHGKIQEQVQFPQNVVVDYNDQQTGLTLTGLTVRKKFFLKIYSMAHYVEQKPGTSVAGDEIYQYILQQFGAKQISMVFLRALTAEQIQKSLISGIKLNTSEDEYLQILPQVETFMAAIYEDVKENDEFIIRWFPDGTMVSLFQGEQISSIKDEQFAKTLWSIWFGEHSVVDRDSLVKQLITSS
jgi:chalcone isomerase-like protein